jgi:hypothetical protein
MQIIGTERVGKIKGGGGIYPKTKLQELANGSCASKYHFALRHSGVCTLTNF